VKDIKDKVNVTIPHCECII